MMAGPHETATPQAIDQATAQAIDQAIDQATAQAIDQAIDQATAQAIDRNAEILEFYRTPGSKRESSAW